MRLLYFFDDHVKKYIMRGKKYCNPADTGVIGSGISCIRENDVNIYFYTKNGTTIAFDAGHLGFSGLDGKFRSIDIDPLSIEHVFLTHADVDHAGGIDSGGRNIFPYAQIYMGRNEEQYLLKTHHRMVKLGVKLNNCVRIDKGYKLLDDGQILYTGGIKIEVIATPGHTLGHLCYLIDDRILISGDCLAVNENGGYSFFDFFTQYPDMNKESLHKLRERISGRDIIMVCTGHSGVRTTERLFDHIDESAVFSRRKPFDEKGPSDFTRYE